MTSAPKAVLVLDVNVLIDIINPAAHPATRAAAQTTLTTNRGLPIYISDEMLETTSIKLLELGMKPDILREYVELLMLDDDFGPELHVLEDVLVTDYGLTDKYGHSDYEDSTVVSLMDAAEAQTGLPALLVSSDGALRDWCTDHNRTAVRPDMLSRVVAGKHSDLDQAAIQYLSRRGFQPGHQPMVFSSAKPLGKEIVSDVRSAINTAELEQRYRKFPELRPDDSNMTAEVDQTSLER